MNSLAFVTLALVLGAAMAIYRPAYTYQGRWPGYCLQDGIYVHDYNSLYFCSGGASSVQNCAPGSRTSQAALHKIASLNPRGNYGYDYVMQIVCDEHVPVYQAPAPKPYYPAYPKHY